jgi:hypothetical protein
MGTACSTYRRDGKCVQYVAVKPERKRTLGRCRSGWYFNIKIDHKETVYEGMYMIRVAQTGMSGELL